jgi:hypothetical protein
VAISNPVTIGQNVPVSPSALGTVTHNSTAVVPSGGKIFTWVRWWSTPLATLDSITYGGTAGTVHFTVTNGANRAAFCSFDAVSGLPNASAITGTFSTTGADSRYIASAYSTGVATGAPTATAQSTTGTTTWSAGPLTVPSGSILIGGSGNGTGVNLSNTGTNTPSGGNTEIHDFNVAGDSGLTTCYQIGTGASISSSGTWSADVSPLMNLTAQFDAAGGTTPAPLRRMPLSL